MIRLLDRFARRPRGELVYDVWQGDDTRECLVSRHVGRNLVLTNAEIAIVHALGGVASKNISQFGVGSSGVAPALGDNALTAAVLVAVGAITYPTTTSIAIAWSVARGVATGLSIREFGLFTADNTLVARKVRAAPILKGADIRIAGTWTLHF